MGISQTLTNKARLETVLAGEAPDQPPHFELVFYLAREMFGLDQQAVESKYTPNSKAWHDALVGYHTEVSARLIDELGWAAIPADVLDTRLDPLEMIPHFKAELGDRALVFAFNGQGVYWMPSGSDIMDFVVTMFEKPEELHAGARAKLAAAQELARRQVDAGVDFIIQNSDFGFNQGPFISPAHFREFVTPYMTEFVQTVHDLGVPVILHSDGNLNEILDQLYETGIDGYQSVDPQGDMDIRAVREQYPEWILMGNVNCSMLQDTREQEIRESVQYCMTYGGMGKPYILSTSNCIFPGMPPESYWIMLDEYRRMADLHRRGLAE
ncbi:MAG: hypothetical protein GX552_04375 [Chloroflexi bacterium]|jgi:uroporphyrinogen decarboxylase|nr:hypothetical protein [Chloroflexota bacterium]